jgi:hypothetical protein
VDGPARFVSLLGSPVWLTDLGMRLALVPPAVHRPVRRSDTGAIQDDHIEAALVTGAHVFLTFEGANRDARVIGAIPARTEANYFIGSDPGHWANHIPTWSRLHYEGLYPGVSIDVHGDSGRLEYDLRLEPGADLQQVVIRVDGAESLALESDGSLRIDTAAGPLVQPLPRTWEEDGTSHAHVVACMYRVIDGHHFGFRVSGRNPARRLVIDPALRYASFLGGDSGEIGSSIVGDEHGAAIVAGQTDDATTFPTTPGAFDTVPGASVDGFVARFTPDGSGLEFASLIGGSADSDPVTSVALAPDGGIVGAGGTSSVDFPTTPGAFQELPASTTSSNGFVFKLSSDGGQLIFGTYLGGTAFDTILSMALDSEGHPCMSGKTDSVDFPLSPNAFQTSSSASHKMWVARLSADGSALEFGSYYASSGNLDDLAVDLSGAVYLAGSTGPAAFVPVTAGAYDTTNNGFGDVVIAKIDVDLGVIQYCTWLGGLNDDGAYSIAIDKTGRAVVAGLTDSFNFPKTTGAFDTSFNGDEDAFVAAFTPDGSALAFSTFLGSSGFDRAWGVRVSPLGLIYVTGDGGAPNFPVTPDAFKSVAGNGDAFFSVLSPDASKLIYSTYYGGGPPGAIGKFTQPFGVGLDPAGSAYMTGYLTTDEFPATPGAFDTTLSGGTDSYVIAFDMEPWLDLGHGLAGTGGVVPAIEGTGSLQPASDGALVLSGAASSTLAWLVTGVSELDAPLKGGTLVPQPLLLVPLLTKPDGSVSVDWSSWPTGLPAGTTLYFQAWVPDAAAAHGFAASNALGALTPVP